jgi:hypothetical protein
VESTWAFRKTKLGNSGDLVTQGRHRALPQQDDNLNQNDDQLAYQLDEFYQFGHVHKEESFSRCDPEKAKSQIPKA